MPRFIKFHPILFLIFCSMLWLGALELAGLYDLARVKCHGSNCATRISELDMRLALSHGVSTSSGFVGIQVDFDRHVVEVGRYENPSNDRGIIITKSLSIPNSDVETIQALMSDVWQYGPQEEPRLFLDGGPGTMMLVEGQAVKEIIFYDAGENPGEKLKNFLWRSYGQYVP